MFFINIMRKCLLSNRSVKSKNIDTECAWKMLTAIRPENVVLVVFRASWLLVQAQERWRSLWFNLGKVKADWKRERGRVY